MPDNENSSVFRKDADQEALNAQKVLVECIRELSGGSADTLRSLADIRDTIRVVLNKLDALETFSSAIGERTKNLDSSHYDLTRENTEKIREIKQSLEDLDKSLRYLRTSVQDVPQTDSFRTSLSNAVESSIKDRCAVHQEKITEDIKATVKAAIPPEFSNAIRLVGSRFVVYSVFGIIIVLVMAVVWLSGTASRINVSPRGISIERMKEILEKGKEERAKVLGPELSGTPK